MATFLAISSQVARGHVGLSAIVPALTSLGHEVIGLPTVVLSNHPGHAHAAGLPVPPENLAAMLDALDANGWLGGIDAVLTGYLPSVAHVRFAARAIDRVRTASPGASIICDPVLGDDPRGLYVEADAAAALRAELVPRADIVKPNRFELAWLAGSNVATLSDAARAAQALARPIVLATSIAQGALRIANIAVGREATVACTVARRADAPHGTGDLLTALFAGHRMCGRPLAEALGRAVAGVDAVLAASLGRDELALTAARASLAGVEPFATEPYATR